MEMLQNREAWIEKKEKQLKEKEAELVQREKSLLKIAKNLANTTEIHSSQGGGLEAIRMPLMELALNDTPLPSVVSKLAL